MKIARRTVLGALGAGLGCAGLQGCETFLGGDAETRDLPVIDPHAHIFNASDLPVAKFVRLVVLKDHEHRNLNDAEAAELSDVIYSLLEVIVRIVQAGAPHAMAEACRLDPSAEVCAELEFPGAFDGDVSSEMLQEDTGDAGRTRARDRRVLKKVLRDLLTDDPDREIPEVLAPDRAKVISARELLRRRLLKELGDTGAEVLESPRPETIDLKGAIDAIFSAPGVISRHIRWALLFLHYRYQNANRYEKAYGVGPGAVALYTPSLIDFTHWLENDRPPSDLKVQMIAMEAVQRTRKRVRMHGFFPFDPWREIVESDRAGEDDAKDTPRQLAKLAIEVHGFIGIKLYPPMGFRPVGNAELEGRFPPEAGAIDDFADRLDDVLLSTYVWVVSEGVPVLAHAENSNFAGPGYGRRASPEHWGEVLRRRFDGQDLSKLRLNLGHFGGFDEAFDEETGELDRSKIEQTWEWKFGELLRLGHHPYLVADLSYLSEVLYRGAKARRRIGDLETLLKLFVATFDPQVRHIMFGSDWLMLAREPRHQDYISFVRTMAEAVFGTASQKANFFGGNAARYLGLGRDQPTRLRLEAYDERHGGRDLGFWRRFDGFGA